jgi:hypothetical protein
MRFLIVNTDYGAFLHQLYSQHHSLETAPYEDQMRVRNESLFGVADFYSSNLRKLGHQAWDIHVNNEFMQKAWASEHGMQVADQAPTGVPWAETFRQMRSAAAKTRLRALGPLFRPMLRSLDRQQTWLYDTVAAQIKAYKPDILLNFDIGLSSHFFQEMKPDIRLLIGQHAAPLPREHGLRVYDLMISSLPNFVDYFRRQGLHSELHRLGFEPAVLDRLGETRESMSVSFVGSLARPHVSRQRWLDYVCQAVRVGVWAQDANGLPSNSPVVACYQGTAWGVEMYRILRGSQITLNHHIDVAENYANNMRLFEATGVGTLLITDWKENLHEMFDVGSEVVGYRSTEECVELIHYYLEHAGEREAIARAGEQRTLRDHTYYQRMQGLVDIVQRYL